jgi:hypothetical protein
MDQVTWQTQIRMGVLSVLVGAVVIAIAPMLLPALAAAGALVAVIGVILVAIGWRRRD